MHHMRSLIPFPLIKKKKKMSVNVCVNREKLWKAIRETLAYPGRGELATRAISAPPRRPTPP